MGSAESSNKTMFQGRILDLSSAAYRILWVKLRSLDALMHAFDVLMLYVQFHVLKLSRFRISLCSDSF